MKKLLLIGMFVFGSSQSFALDMSCTNNYFQQTKPIINNNVFKQKAREVCFNGFAVMHSGVTRTPLWSAQIMTKEKMFAPKLKRQDNFHEEESIPSNERATLRDYQGSGYNKGHLTPNGDLVGRDSKNDSFSLSNIVPQNPNNNQVLWEGIETSVRNLVKNKSDAYVITGALFLDGQHLINRRVAIPSHLFKIVYLIKTNQVSAYYVENKATMDYEVISLAQLEKMAGINFFPSVSANIKNAKVDLPAPQISNRNRSNNNFGHHSKASNHYSVRSAQKDIHSILSIFK